MVDPLRLHADGLTLVYHEARHVRFLIKREYLASTGWENLRSLPRNRCDAWKHLQPLRQAAQLKQTAAEAAAVFRQCFHQGLNELLDLYTNLNWKHASLGGNMWHRVTELVAALAQAIDCGDADAIQKACVSLLNGQHNTGTLREKILDLDTSIGAVTDKWWRLGGPSV